MRIVVTGGSGKAGRWVVRDLREHGHDVLNVDAKHDGSVHGLCLVADLADDGQAFEALKGTDAVGWNLWGYVDCRDVALACRLGLEAEVTGAEVCIIAAADTVMPQPERRPDGRGVPGRAAHPSRRRPRDAAVDRSWAPDPGLRAGPSLGGPRRGALSAFGLGAWPREPANPARALTSSLTAAGLESCVGAGAPTPLSAT